MSVAIEEASVTRPIAGRGYYWALTAASTAMWALLLGPVLTTLPGQIALIAPHDRVASLAMVTSIGGVLGIVTNPLIGRLSDGTRTRLGRRRPWLIGGVIVIIPAALAAGHVTSLAALILCWALLQIGANILMPNGPVKGTRR